MTIKIQRFHFIAAILCNIFWAGLFPLTYISVFIFLSMNPNAHFLYALALSIALPFSYLLTIGLVWRNYLRQKIPQMYWCNLLPLATLFLCACLSYPLTRL